MKMKALLFFGLVAALVLPTSLSLAANTKDSYYAAYFTMSVKAYETGYRKKENTSKVYMRIDKNTASGGAHVTVWGAHNDAGSGTSDVTVNSPVVFKKGEIGKFSLSNNVRELGFRYCELYLVVRGAFGGEISGVWSPDSTRNYTVKN